MKRIIGITGGVGAGKSRVMGMIRDLYGGELLMADEIAHQLMLPGGSCYQALTALFGDGVLDERGQIDKGKMAQLIFQDTEKRLAVNEIVHPAVKKAILRAIDISENELIAVEAALLIEGGFDDICNELWYIYAAPAVRIERLLHSRGYSREKSARIMASQLSDDEFRKHCQVIIDNSKTEADLQKQLEKYLKK